MQQVDSRLSLLLSGGGDASDAFEYHREFAKWLSPGNRILYVPGGALLIDIIR
jgi:hypothetical protein